MSAVTKSYVLERTLGDILCENSEIAEVQQWVTLQPDNQFNKMVGVHFYTHPLSKYFRRFPLRAGGSSTFFEIVGYFKRTIVPQERVDP